MRILENVQQKTIQPMIESIIAPGAMVYTDEYDIYFRREDWGVCAWDSLSQKR